MEFSVTHLPRMCQCLELINRGCKQKLGTQKILFVLMSNELYLINTFSESGIFLSLKYHSWNNKISIIVSLLYNKSCYHYIYVCVHPYACVWYLDLMRDYKVT